VCFAWASGLFSGAGRSGSFRELRSGRSVKSGKVRETLAGLQGEDFRKAGRESAFLTTPSSSNWNPLADVNNDGVVNMRDIALLVSTFANTAIP
jgi:hypothetical protein